MILNSPINEINWSSIEAFCDEKITEGTFLEYKESFPTKLEKTISAFANTYGGVILIGVEEDDSNKPVTPIKGVDFIRGLSEKITHIILSNITPPLIPEIKVCQSDDGTEAVIIIRIPQSDIAPHAISSNTKVYIRTNDLNNPEEIASLDRIEWLRNNRSKSEELKEFLIDQAKERSNELKFKGENHLHQLGLVDSHYDRNNLSISIIPAFPMGWHKTPNEIIDEFDNLRIIDDFGTLRYFPPSDSDVTGHTKNISQDGVFLTHERSGDRFFYTELNSHGLFYYDQNIETIFRDNKDFSFLNATELFSRIKSSLAFSHSYFKFIEYWGLVEMRIELTNILNTGIYYLPGTLKKYGSSLDNHFCLSKNILVGNLEIDFETIMFWIFKRIGWLFGRKYSEQDFAKVWKTINP